jgi:hypothetical protein
MPSDQSASAAVAAFITGTWQSGDRFLIVARPQRWHAVSSKLRQEQILTDNSRDADRLIVLDAEDALRQFMRNGMPDRELFRNSVGRRVARLAESGGNLRIYGEIVDILAGQNNFAAAHALEELWNELGESHAFTLLCGYAPERFSSSKGWDDLQAVCTAHARILPS